MYPSEDLDLFFFNLDFIRYVTKRNVASCRFHSTSTWQVNYLILILGCNRNYPNMF